jgi:antitoxin component YwqK of YwqJK toxin-antitoxin module
MEFMFIKPKSNDQKPKKHNPKKPKSKKQKQLKEWMTPDELMQLSRDYVLEHERLTVLSKDYVIEHGREWTEDIWYDSYGYRICDLSGEEEVPITGLLYELFDDGSLSWYGYYEDGLKTGVDVDFYQSGEIRRYRRQQSQNENGVYYKWYEDGMIKWIRANCEGYLYIAIARNGKLKWLTSSDIYAWRGGDPIPEQP